MLHTPTSHHTLKASLAVLLATAALTGCAVGPEFRAPAPPTEQAYLPSGAPPIAPAAPGEPAQAPQGRLGTNCRPATMPGCNA